MAPILRFVKLLCLHLESCFSENELIDLNILETAALSNVTSFNFGELRLRAWLECTQHFLEVFEEACRSITVQYRDFRFLVSEKLKLD